MNNKLLALLFAGSVLAVPSAALAQVAPGSLSVSISGGADFPVGGTMHDGTTATVSDLGALNPALAGVPATLQIERRSQKDVYDAAWTIGGELGYGVSDTGEVLLSLRYTEAKGKQLNVGTATAGAPVNSSFPISGDFSNYKAFSAEVGYRQYLGSGERMKPFVAAHAGATHVSAISADFTIPGAGIALNNTPFSKSSWVFSGGGEVGVSIPLSKTVSLEPEAGIQYIAGPKGDDSALGGLGLGSINDKGERWSVPVRVRLKVVM